MGNFWQQWLQKLMCMFVSIKVLVLLLIFIAIFTNTPITAVTAGIITCVLGIREAYKIWAPIKSNSKGDTNV